MRTTRVAISWSAVVLMSGVGVACTAALRTDPVATGNGLAQLTSQERRDMRDSAIAQRVADEVGPRVTVAADFDYAGGSRRVEARFHMYDDAYVIVGHLDAAGRLRVVFPSQPGDDGFVRGDKIYHVPSFFAGFGDEYAWRYMNYRYSTHSVATRRDSYDAGLGYVFVVASWRPMRLDRISDGHSWQTYEVSDISYMSDPREAIEELGALIAGDNREAYTIEYAHYTTTNYGTYSFADFDAVNSGCYGYSSFGLFFHHGFLSPFGFLPSQGFGFGPVSCRSLYGSYAYGYPYGYGYGYGQPVTYVPVTSLPGRRGPIATPLGLPGLHLPRVEGGPGGLALHQPGTETPTSGPVNNSGYRRPGLIAEDAGIRRTPGERHETGNDLTITSRRPTIQQMIGERRIDEDARARGGASGAAIVRDNPSWASRGGYNAPRSGDANNGMRDGGRTYTPSHDGGRSYTPSHDGGRSYGGESRGYTPRNDGGGRAAPSHAEPRSESPRFTPHSEPAARPAPVHSEPAARPSPPPASSAGSDGSKKP